MKKENVKTEDYESAKIYRSGMWGGGKKIKAGSMFAHKLKIDKEWYSFIGYGWRQYVYKEDTCSFEYDVVVKGTGILKRTYKNIDLDTLEVFDKNGVRVWRGYDPSNTPNSQKKVEHRGSTHIYDREHAH